MEDKLLPGDEPLGGIIFGRFSDFLCYFRLIDFFNIKVNLSIENNKGKQKNLPNYITPNGSSPGNDLSPERHGE